MNIYRLPPYPISVTYDVPEPDTDYVLVISDGVLRQDYVVSLTSDENSQVSYLLGGALVEYDESYDLTIYEDLAGELGEPVVQDTLNVVRPYVNPEDIAPDITELEKYKKYEEIARAVIDDYVGRGGFGFRRSVVETVGQGTDYMPLWGNANKILFAYENTKKVWDSSQDPSALDHYNYLITRDGSAITKDPISLAGTTQNRHEQYEAKSKFTPSDSFTVYDTADNPATQFLKSGVLFPKGWDYIFILETGYKVVPLDVKRATEMLIEDIACGKLEYYQRFVTTYSTDQYRVRMDSSVLDGTGNLLVDKILNKYVVSLDRPGVL
jgi:hypothetical protein